MVPRTWDEEWEKLGASSLGAGSGSAWSTGPPRLPPALRRDRARKAVLVFHKPQLKPLQN